MLYEVITVEDELLRDLAHAGAEARLEILGERQIEEGGELALSVFGGEVRDAPPDPAAMCRVAHGLDLEIAEVERDGSNPVVVPLGLEPRAPGGVGESLRAPGLSRLV